MRLEQTYMNSFNKNKIYQLIDEHNLLVKDEDKINANYDYDSQSCIIASSKGNIFEDNQFMVVKKLRDMINEKQK